jgi:hypothetical protein
MTGRPRIVASAASLLSLFGYILATAPLASAEPVSPCVQFWQGPVTATSSNHNYPDEFAAYWGANWADGSLPEGAKLVLRGRFPHARYMSFNTYNFGRPSPGPNDSLYDAQIEPDPGSTNGFRPGERRDSADRDYTVTIVNGTPPPAGTPRPANTVYTGSAGLGTTFVYRVYLPDEGADLSGGVGLPDVTLELPGEEPITDPAKVCDALELQRLGGPTGLMPIATYSNLRTTTSVPGEAPPATHPAVDPPRWERWFNYRYSVVGYFHQPYDGFEHPLVDRTTIPSTGTGGPLSNKDAYSLITFADRGFGAKRRGRHARGSGAKAHRSAAGTAHAKKTSLVIRGRAPSVPETLEGNRTFGSGDVRYWSFCQNELFSSRVIDCIVDEEIPVDSDGDYTLVTSLAAHRPANARTKCGFAWMEWSPNGDGAPDFDPSTGGAIPDTALPREKGGRPEQGFIGYRQILPSPDFVGSIANVSAPGEESALGDYLPKARYMTRSKFQSLGCPAKRGKGHGKHHRKHQERGHGRR